MTHFKNPLPLLVMIVTACLLSNGLLAQTSFTGKVVDEAGNPISNVTVQIKGTKKLTATNADGKYSIIGAATDVLVFTSVGYATIIVRADKAASVKLLNKATSLADVVVIGYGDRRRKDLTSSVGSIKGEDLIKAPVASFDQALQGRIAGVQVIASSGDPGGNVSVRIRGNATVSNTSSNDPLYVVDDIVLPQGTNLSSINASDIESIDVLKDAAATAIYGIRSANGVVLVKTKKGSKDKSRLSLDMYTGVSQAWKKMKVQNIQEHALLNNEIIGQYNLDNAAIVSFTPVPLNPEWSTPERIANLPKQGTDWQDEVFRNGQVKDVTVGMSGSLNKTSYYFSLSHRNEEGIIINSSFKRYSIRANVDQEVKDWLKVGASLTYSDSRRTVTGGTNDDRSGFMQAVLLTPTAIPVYGSDGSAGQAPSRNINWYGNLYNPVNLINALNPRYKNNNLFGSVYANVKLPFNIRFNSTLGVGQGSGGYTVFNGNLINIAGASSVRGQIFEGRFSGLNWNWDNYLNWSKWIKGHSIDLTAGHIAQYISDEGIGYTQQGFVNQARDFQLIGLGDPGQISFPATYPKELAYESYFGRASYNYNEKYYVSGTYRIDKGSPAYATKNKVAYFPAVSAKWRLSKEKFLENNRLFNDLAIRGSWGISGNIGPSPYPGFSLVKLNSNYPFGAGASVPGVSLAQFPNIGSTWEKVYQTDIGLDASLFNGKITATVDVYNRNTRNMLLPSRIRNIFGKRCTSLVNIPGQGVINKGIEAAITYNNNSKEFKYSISGNVSFNKNVVKDIGEVPFIELPADLQILKYQPSRTAVGNPIGSFYGWVTDGIYQNAGEVAKGPVDLLGRASGGSRPGDIRFKDLNGDNKIDEADRTFIGNPTPSIIYGISLSGSYKGFDFSMLIQGVGGNKIFNYLFQQATMGDPKYNDGINRLAVVNDRWVDDGKTHSFPRLNFDDRNNGFNTRLSDFWLQSGAYTRIKNVQLGYTFSSKLIKSATLEKLRLYVSANNLLTLTKYKGFDPEIGQNTTGYQDVFSGNLDLQAGIDRGVFPQARMLIVGVNVIF